MWLGWLADISIDSSPPSSSISSRDPLFIGIKMLFNLHCNKREWRAACSDSMEAWKSKKKKINIINYLSVKFQWRLEKSLQKKVHTSGWLMALLAACNSLETEPTSFRAALTFSSNSSILPLRKDFVCLSLSTSRISVSISPIWVCSIFLAVSNASFKKNKSKNLEKSHFQ